jgi:hypothetical protein
MAFALVAETMAHTATRKAKPASGGNSLSIRPRQSNGMRAIGSLAATLSWRSGASTRVPLAVIVDAAVRGAACASSGEWKTALTIGNLLKSVWLRRGP